MIDVDLGGLVSDYGLPLVVALLAFKLWQVMRSIEKEARSWVEQANQEVTLKLQDFAKSTSEKLDEVRASIDKMSEAITARMLAETEHALRINRLEARTQHLETLSEQLSRELSEVRGRLQGSD